MIVEKKSINGFKCVGSKWYQCDKFKLINSDMFKNLKVNDHIECIECNKDNFVIKFIVLNREDLGSKGGQLPSSFNTPNSLKCPSLPNIDIKAHEILRAQCLNIVFNSMFHNELTIEHQDKRDRAIRLSQELLVELEQADFYKW